jgi:hypothetical protein
MKSDPTAGIDSRLSHLEADPTPCSDTRQCAGNARAALADHAADRRTAPRDPATAFDSRRVAGARSLLLCKRAWPLTSAWHSPQTKATRPRADNPEPPGAQGRRRGADAGLTAGGLLAAALRTGRATSTASGSP